MKPASLLIAAALLLGSGCATRMIETSKASQLAEGQPPTYAEGYSIGYVNGVASNGDPYGMFKATKDVQRYLTDPLYKLGWDDGYRAAGGKR